MIIVDGRTDVEKLHELLALPEQDGLDFKRVFEIAAGKGRVAFVKDAVAMANQPRGGYIILGVTDDGAPCQLLGACGDRSLFDGAKLRQMIDAYVDGAIAPITQWHEIAGNEVLLIYIPGNSDGLPLPMVKGLFALEGGVIG